MPLTLLNDCLTDMVKVVQNLSPMDYEERVSWGHRFSGHRGLIAVPISDPPVLHWVTVASGAGMMATAHAPLCFHLGHSAPCW